MHHCSFVPIFEKTTSFSLMPHGVSPLLQSSNSDTNDVPYK